MKGTRQILLEKYNELDTFTLDDDMSKKLKCILLMICKDIFNFCKKHEITVMLGGGSVLGAVRHNGFIPWDDDLDLNMPREDYDRFSKLFEKEMSHKYTLFVPDGHHEITNLFMKVSLNGTSIKDIYTVDNNIDIGICIDIFPLENVPENVITRHIKGRVAEVFSLACVSNYIYNNQNRSMRDAYKKTFRGDLLYKCRYVLGFLMSFKSYKWWYHKYDSFVQTKKDCGVYTFPTGRRHYIGEIQPGEVFFPLVKAKFEDAEFYIPGGYDIYLRNLYGNYMELPPEEKRERHFYTKIDFGEYE